MGRMYILTAFSYTWGSTGDTHVEKSTAFSNTVRTCKVASPSSPLSLCYRKSELLWASPHQHGHCGWHIAPFWVDIGRNQLGLALTATSRLNPLHELSFCHVRILSIFNPHLPLTVPAQTLAFSRSNFCHSLTANAFCPCTGVGFGFKFPWIALLCSSRRVNAHCYSARPNHYSVDDFDSAYHFRAPSTVCIVKTLRSISESVHHELVMLGPMLLLA